MKLKQWMSQQYQPYASGFKKINKLLWGGVTALILGFIALMLLANAAVLYTKLQGGQTFLKYLLMDEFTILKPGYLIRTQVLVCFVGTLGVVSWVFSAYSLCAVVYCRDIYLDDYSGGSMIMVIHYLTVTGCMAGLFTIIVILMAPPWRFDLVLLMILLASYCYYAKNIIKP